MLENVARLNLEAAGQDSARKMWLSLNVSVISRDFGGCITGIDKLRNDCVSHFHKGSKAYKFQQIHC